MSEEETQSTNPSAPIEEIRKSSPLMETIKAFNLTTFAGIALLLIFGFCMMFTTLYVRWWLMIPLAAAGAWLLHNRHQDATGLEKQVCRYGFWLFLVFLLFRDIVLSHKMAGLIDNLKDMSSAIETMFK